MSPLAPKLSPLVSTGRDWLPAGFHRKVSDHYHPPFPSFSWRKLCPHSPYSFPVRFFHPRLHAGLSRRFRHVPHSHIPILDPPNHRSRI
jgi:hypothetical protein